MLQDIQNKIEAEFEKPIRNEAKLTFLIKRQAKLEAAAAAAAAAAEAERQSLMIKIEAELRNPVSERNESILVFLKERLQIIETGCSRISPTFLF